MQPIGQAVVEEKTFGRAAARVCEILQREIGHYSWVGVYRLDGNELVLEAWAGPRATEHVRIPLDRGICGAAAREGKTVVVDDVRSDPRYLACFPSTRSEIVVPIRLRGKVVGEVDVDSDRPAAFHDLDRQFLEWVAELLGEAYAREGRS